MKIEFFLKRWCFVKDLEKNRNFSPLPYNITYVGTGVSVGRQVEADVLQKQGVAQEGGAAEHASHRQTVHQEAHQRQTGEGCAHARELTLFEN